jgi:predicted secreted protein
MGILSIIFTFVMSWWTVLFITLPWGNRQPDKGETGMAYGAPSNPNLKKKMIATTVLSFVVTIIVYYVIDADIIDFRGKALEYEQSIYGVNTDTDTDN